LPMPRTTSEICSLSLHEPLPISMDDTIASAERNGVRDFIFTLGYVPPWASKNPADPCGSTGAAGTCDAPDMRAFDDFLTQLVRRDRKSTRLNSSHGSNSYDVFCF